MNQISLSIIFLFLLFTKNTHSQDFIYPDSCFNKKCCFRLNPNINKYVSVSCNNPAGAPYNYETMDMDSMLHSLSVEFIKFLNNIREEQGSVTLKYDSVMYECVSLRHNTWQVENNKISHTGSVTHFNDKLKWCGYHPFMTLSECVSSISDFVFDTDTTKSLALDFYKDSPSHWNSLTNPEYSYISISILYREDVSTFFTTVNLRN